MESAMPPPSSQPPIIVKKIIHHGHHGGAWKVAYADFVTAMMALFIVLWLLSSSQKVQKAVGGYFRDPKGAGKMVGNTRSATGEGLLVQPDDMNQLKKKIEAAMKKEVKDFDKLQEFVEITVTEEGLRIELIESGNSTFFESGNSAPTPDGSSVLTKLSEQLASLQNNIVIEGHTDSKPFGTSDSYTNWELSVDRANAARRLMIKNGIAAGRVVQIRGFADHRLRRSDDPLAASNRRVSVIVKFEDDVEPGKANEGVAG